MKQIGSQDARQRFRDLLDDAQRGESAEITRNGKPVAYLVPAEWFRNALAVQKGAYAFTHDTDGGRLPGESELPVGELYRLIGEMAIDGLPGPELAGTPKGERP